MRKVVVVVATVVVMVSVVVVVVSHESQLTVTAMRNEIVSAASTS